MGIELKTKKEIEIMRAGGKMLAKIVDNLGKEAKPGVSTGYLDKLAKKMCDDLGVEPAFLNYHGYPAIICANLNDVVVHGIPSSDEYLKDGDLIGIDMGIKYKGFYSDHARTYVVGEGGEVAKKIVMATELSRDAGIANAIVGKTIGDIGFAMEEVAKMFGFSVVLDLVGHGVGRELHEDPEVPGYGEKGQGIELVEGMVIAIEAMLNEGIPDVKISGADGWTTTTKDGKLSALFEHTVAVGKTKPRILTAL